MSYFQACCDRKLSKIGAIIQESVGVETQPINIVTKILTIMEHYVSSAFGVNEAFTDEVD